MALIPKKSSASIIGDSGLGLEVVLIILGIVVIGDSILEQYISKQLSMVLLGVLIAIVAYLILPTHINHGQCGYMRILIWLRYRFEKLKERLARM